MLLCFIWFGSQLDQLLQPPLRLLETVGEAGAISIRLGGIKSVDSE